MSIERESALMGQRDFLRQQMMAALGEIQKLNLALYFQAVGQGDSYAKTLQAVDDHLRSALNVASAWNDDDPACTGAKP